jgi:hypothetical protein
MYDVYRLKVADDITHHPFIVYGIKIPGIPFQHQNTANNNKKIFIETEYPINMQSENRTVFKKYIYAETVL